MENRIAVTTDTQFDIAGDLKLSRAFRTNVAGEENYADDSPKKKYLPYLKITTRKGQEHPLAICVALVG